MVVAGGGHQGGGGGAIGDGDVFQAGDGIRGRIVTGGQTCGLPIFGDRALDGGRGGEVDAGVGDGVVDVGGGAGGADHQVLEIAARGAGDVGGDRKSVV